MTSVCSVEGFILDQENKNAAQKTERDVLFLKRLLKVIPAVVPNEY